MPTPRDWTPSQKHEASSTPALVGRYRILFPIASGGMGTVYAARVEGSHGIGRTVALKVMKPEAEVANLLPSFLDEARITTRLDHPNVVRTIELGQDGAITFLAMDFVRGVSLRDLLKRMQTNGERLAPELGAWIVSRAAAGLHSAHELTTPDGIALGLVHRDVSPDNILIGYDGSVRVTDFGIAKIATAEKTREGVIKGKFAYMSPEQVSGDVLDRRSDLFSLGVVLWEALACRRLFRGKTARDTVAQILSGKVPLPSVEGAELPPALVDVAMHCLSSRAEQRPETARDLEQSLRAAIRGAGKTVDDADVADVVCRVFEQERVELEARLVQAERSGPLDIALPASPEPSASAAGISLESTRRTRRGPARIVLSALAILALVFAGGIWLVSREAPRVMVSARPTLGVVWPSASSSAEPVPAVSSVSPVARPPNPIKREPKLKKNDHMFEKL